MAHELRGSAAVVGIGLTEFGELPGKNHLEVLAEASHYALADAGLGMQDVDGLFVSSMGRVFHPLHAAEYLGIQPSVIDGTNVGGSSFVNCVQSAAMAIKTGVCNVALIAYGSTSRSNRKRKFREYGTTRENLAQVAVSTREWAMKNPRAEMRDPLSIEDVLGARMICDPLTLFDCCLVSDAGAAIVMVSAERAKDFPQKPAYLLGVGSATTHDQIAQMPDLTVTPASQSGPRAFAMAGLTPADIDVAEFYDAFTINTILFLEDLGFCKKGEGGAFVGDGNIGPGGSLPVNTNGGGLSCVHPGMYGMFVTIEAVEQLRGTCGERQIEGANIALANGNGGVLSSQVTAIYGSEAAL
jgi:acetyl-CoA acetyltransferase